MKRATQITLLAALACLAQASLACDETGLADHSLLPRYDGSCLERMRTLAFDEFRLPLGPVVRNEDRSYSPSESKLLEGAFTRLVYSTEAGRTPLEVMRNYQDGLMAAGFEALYSCAGQDCGHGSGKGLIDAIFPGDQRASADTFLVAFTNQHRYAAFAKPDGSVHIALHVGYFGGRAYQDKTILTAIVVESEAMEMRLVDAAAMNRSIAENGRIALQNIYFEFGSARLTAESDPALAEMAKLLSDNPALDVYVVGHTDNVGAIDTNLGLSRERAAAVVMALEQRFGTSSGRAIAAGVGSYAPVASNLTEAGRAENRRVELVMR